MHSKSIIAFLLVLLFVSCQTKPKKNILFIGNSYTYRNNMPNFFTQLCAENGKDVSVTYVTRGKYTISLQSKRKQVLDALNEKKWDVIVLQGSSKDLLRDSITLKTKTLPAVEKFKLLFNKKQKKAQVYLFMTWSYQTGFAKLERTNTPNKMTEQVAIGYQKLARKFKFKVLPVGLVWNSVRLKNKSISLYESDKAHPSKFGSYLVANCLYKGIFKERNKVFNFTISGDLKKEKVLQKAAFSFAEYYRKINK